MCIRDRDIGIISSGESRVHQERAVSLNLRNADLSSTEHGSESISAIAHSELGNLNTNSEIPTKPTPFDETVTPVEVLTNVSQSNITRFKVGTDKGLKTDINYMDQNCDQDGVKIEVNISLGWNQKNVSDDKLIGMSRNKFKKLKYFDFSR